MDNLEWQWTDLMPGDIVRISKEFENRIKEINGDYCWINGWVNKDIKILNCNVIERGIRLETDCCTGIFSIKTDGTFWNSYRYGNIIPFDIVKLIED